MQAVKVVGAPCLLIRGEVWEMDRGARASEVLLETMRTSSRVVGEKEMSLRRGRGVRGTCRSTCEHGPHDATIKAWLEITCQK